jgi:hypothetical protein
MGETPQKPLALDYASPELARRKRLRMVVGFGALFMFMSTIAAAAFSSFGPLVVALCLWAFAVAATVAFVVACVKLRRAQSGEDETMAGESTAG